MTDPLVSPAPERLARLCARIASEHVPGEVSDLEWLYSAYCSRAGSPASCAELIEEIERVLSNEDLTRGEWKAGEPAWFRGRQNPESGKRPITVGEQGVIANVYGKANAEFIAAAPRLLRAVLSLLRAHEETKTLARVDEQQET